MRERFEVVLKTEEKPPEFLQDGNFHPVGVLKHIYYPIELVGVSELGKRLRIHCDVLGYRKAVEISLRS
jgi:hypothetical protein